MQTKRAILLAVTSVGILGVLGAAIAGQSAFSVPASGDDEVTSKTIVLNRDKTIGHNTEGEDFYYVAADQAEDDKAHDPIRLRAQNYYHDGADYAYGTYTYGNLVEDSSYFFKMANIKRNDAPMLTVGLNGINSFTVNVAVTCDSSVHVSWYFLPTAWSETKTILKSGYQEIAAGTDVAATIPGTYDGAKGDARYLLISAGAEIESGNWTYSITSMTVAWSC